MPIDDVVRVATAAAAFDWTWAVSDLDRLAEPGLVATIGSYPTHGGGSARVLEALALVVFEVADPAAAFTDITARIATVIGPDDHRSGEPTFEMRWDRSSVVIVVRVEGGSIALELINPRVQSMVDAGPKVAYGKGAIHPHPGSWEDFELALAITLSRLPYDSSLWLHPESEDQPLSIRFHIGVDRLHCEMIHDEIPELIYEFAAGEEDRLADLGWQAPDADSSGRWHWTIEDPTPASEYEVVAALVTNVFEEILLISEPDDLFVLPSVRGSELIPDIAGLAFQVRW